MILVFSSKIFVELIITSILQEIQIKEGHGRAVMAAFILNALTGWVIVFSHSLLLFFLSVSTCLSVCQPYLSFSYSLTVFLFVSQSQYHGHNTKTLEGFYKYNHVCYPDIVTRNFGFPESTFPFPFGVCNPDKTQSASVLYVMIFMQAFPR